MKSGEKTVRARAGKWRSAMSLKKKIGFVAMCFAFAALHSQVSRASEEDHWCDDGRAYLELASGQCETIGQSICQTLCGPSYCEGCPGEKSCGEPYYDADFNPGPPPQGGWAQNVICECMCTRL